MKSAFISRAGSMIKSRSNNRTQKKNENRRENLKNWQKFRCTLINEVNLLSLFFAFLLSTICLYVAAAKVNWGNCIFPSLYMTDCRARAKTLKIGNWANAGTKSGKRRKTNETKKESTK